MELQQLWVNGSLIDGASGEPLDATLHVGPTVEDWMLDTVLGDHSPYSVTYALAMQLPDGRMLHGRARLSSAEGDRLSFRGLGPLGGTIEPRS